MVEKRTRKPKIPRKVFYYKDDKKMEIKAGGVLFVHGKEKRKVLIQKVFENVEIQPLALVALSV